MRHSSYWLSVILTAYLLLIAGMPFSYAQKRNSGNSNPAIAEALFLDGLKAALTENYPQAIELLQKSLALQPNNAAAHFKLAQIYREQNKYDTALTHSLEAINLDNNNQYYYVETAELYGTIGQLNQAANYLEQMLDKTDAKREHLLNLANVYVQLKQPEKALKTLERAEAELGTSESIITQRQNLYMQMGRMDKVLETGETLVRLNPNNPNYALQQARILMSDNRFLAAQEYLNEFLVNSPSNAYGRFLLGQALLAQNHVPEAMLEFLPAFASPQVPLQEKLDITVGFLGMLPNQQLEAKLFQLTDSVLSAHPTQADAFAMRGDLLMELDRKPEARYYYYQALKRNEGNFSLWQNVLSLGLELGRFDSVAQESEEALALFPNQAVLYYFSGTANLSISQYNQAIRSLEQGLRLSRTNPDMVKIFNMHLGDAYHAAKKYSESDAAYEAALEVDPNDAYILNNYSYYLALRNDKLSKAREMSEDLIETYPEEATYLDTYAWVLFKQKEYTLARNALEKALKFGGSDNGTIIEHYGDILYHLGKPEQALKQWQAAANLGQTSPQLQQKIKDKTYHE